MNNKKQFILGVFDCEEKMIHGAEKIRNKQIDIYDFYTPFPVHGLDDFLGIKRSILPYVTFLAAVSGLCLAIGFQVWTSSASWPAVIGGKPFASIPAFIPITFEITVLLGAHTTVLAFLVINKLFPGRKPLIMDQGQTDDKFVIAIEKEKANFGEVAEILKAQGALDVRETTADMSLVDCDECKK